MIRDGVEDGRSHTDYSQGARTRTAMTFAVDAYRLRSRGVDDVIYRCALSVERMGGSEEEMQRRRLILRGWRSCVDALASARRSRDMDTAVCAFEESLRFELFNETPIGV